MFTVTCPTYESPVLIWTSSIRRITRTPHGTAVGFTCACGANAVTMTGAAAAVPWIVCHGDPPHATTPAATATSQSVDAAEPPVLAGIGSAS